MTKSVLWSSCSRLACSNQQTPDVILCLSDASLLAPKNCPVEGVEPFDYTTIAAVLTKNWRDCDGCGNAVYRYLFSYDESLLAAPSVPLVTADVTGAFCEGCLTSWVEHLVGNESYVRTNDDDSQTFISEHGCEYQLTGGAPPPCVEDSDTIDLELEDGCIIGSVKISADEGNEITARSDGIYAPPSSAPCVSDTASIDFSIDEGGCVTGDVNISADADNHLSLHGDGLYASGADATCVADSDTIDFSIDGDGCVTGDVIAIPLGIPILTGTPGGVLFIDSSGNLAEDLTGTLYYDEVTHRFAVGNTAPKTTIHGSGTTIVGTPPTANANGDLNNSETNLWIDETNKFFVVKVKDSGGVVRQGFVPLVPQVFPSTYNPADYFTGGAGAFWVDFTDNGLIRTDANGPCYAGANAHFLYDKWDLTLDFTGPGANESLWQENVQSFWGGVPDFYNNGNYRGLNSNKFTYCKNASQLVLGMVINPSNQAYTGNSPIYDEDNNAGSQTQFGLQVTTTGDLLRVSGATAGQATSNLSGSAIPLNTYSAILVLWDCAAATLTVWMNNAVTAINGAAFNVAGNIENLNASSCRLARGSSSYSRIGLLDMFLWRNQIMSGPNIAAWFAAVKSKFSLTTY